MLKKSKNIALDWSNTLRQHKLRATPGRLAVLAILGQSVAALNIQQIKKQLGLKPINLATLYRMLKQFRHIGLVRQLNFHQAHACYELQEPTNHHHHLVCQNCGEVKDVKIDDSKLVQWVKRQSKFTIQQHNLEFFGLCAQCSN